jgi:thiol-disulfide isomerase/thioredoxin
VACLTLACLTLAIACLAPAPEKESPPPSVPIGEPAPLALGETLDEQAIDASAFRGRLVVLSFWATWCPPCLKELPRLEELHRAHGQQGLEIVAVNFGETSRTVRKFLRANRVLTLRVTLDPGKAVAQQYGVRGIPATVLLDWNGNVRWATTGYDEGYDQRLREQIVALVKEADAAASPAPAGAATP